jgi:hypothetical protein
MSGRREKLSEQAASVPGITIVDDESTLALSVVVEDYTGSTSSFLFFVCLLIGVNRIVYHHGTTIK